MIEAIPTKRDMNAPIRKWQRFEIDVRGKVRRSEETDSTVVLRTYVMSEGGMGVYAPGSLEIGTHVLVEFSLPGTSRELRLPALIRNRCGFRCGMEFTGLAASDRSLIRSYLRPVVNEDSQNLNCAETVPALELSGNTR